MKFMDLMQQIFTGNNIAILGAALATICPGFGSAKGVGMVGEASSGVIIEDPGKFGKTLVLQALPATQGIYGMITSFLIIVQMGLLGDNPVDLSIMQGAYLFAAAMPITFVGYFSAIKQAKVAVAGINIVAKRPDHFIKGVLYAAMVETYAIFSVLISLLLVIFFKA
jgi:V/A-type H+-transporting ATPase subunit K